VLASAVRTEARGRLSLRFRSREIGRHVVIFYFALYAGAPRHCLFFQLAIRHVAAAISDSEFDVAGSRVGSVALCSKSASVTRNESIGAFPETGQNRSGKCRSIDRD